MTVDVPGVPDLAVNALAFVLGITVALARSRRR